MRLLITVHYRTPKGRDGSYTDTYNAATLEEAKDMAIDCAKLDPRRRVARVTGLTCERV